jgi:tetratricopeptide (TPR) repeat protein
MREEQVKKILSELLMDVPLARGQENRQLYMDALYKAAVFYPVFQDWPSPVLQWIDEAMQLSGELNIPKAETVLGIRHAIVLMRLGDLDGALKQLDKFESNQSVSGDRIICYATATRSRIHTRKEEFDLAHASCEKAVGIRVSKNDWISLLPTIASGELFLQKGELNPARRVFLHLLKELPLKMIEERVQVLQSLGFIYIAKADPKKAARYLKDARRVLTAAGVWSEVIQMNVVIGNFEIAFGKPKNAESLFNEGLKLCQEHQRPTWEPVLQMGLARTKASQHLFQDAIETTLKAATLFADQGNVLGYTSMINLISGIYLQQENYKESYRFLALGLSIAKHLNLSMAENLFRDQINTLRNKHLKPKKFDAMVREMSQEAREAQKKN